VNPEPTEPDPAARLREAATLIRTHLAAPDLTRAPWLCLNGGDRIIHDGPSIEFSPHDYVVDEPVSNSANAEYIALMHPGVGAALAEVFDQWAWLGEQAADLLNRVGGTETLALADQILGEVTR